MTNSLRAHCKLFVTTELALAYFGSTIRVVYDCVLYLYSLLYFYDSTVLQVLYFTCHVLSTLLVFATLLEVV